MSADYQLKITDLNSISNQSPTFTFPALLDKSEVGVTILDTNLQYAPFSYTNNKQFLKTQYTVDFSFIVFSEDGLDGAKKNYDHLTGLFNMVKPRYNQVNEQLVPDYKNIFGLVKVQYAGLPQISNNSDYTIYVNNFSYSMEKTSGYFESGSVLIPKTYRINLSGRVLLPYNETINSSTNTATATEARPVAATVTAPVATTTPATTAPKTKKDDAKKATNKTAKKKTLLEIALRVASGNQTKANTIVKIAVNTTQEKINKSSEAVQLEFLWQLITALNLEIIDELGNGGQQLKREREEPKKYGGKYPVKKEYFFKDELTSSEILQTINTSIRKIK